MWLPRQSLMSCVRCVMSRSTLTADLPIEKRLNYFPASPLCGISWWFSGISEELPFSTTGDVTEPRMEVPSRICFHGPRTIPSMSFNPGPAHGMMLLLLPDAFYRLTGISGQSCVNQFADVENLLPASWVEMCQSMMQESDDDIRVGLIQKFLEPLWQDVRPSLPLQLHRYQDWAQSMAMRAATSGPGRSLRQIERRIKNWAGIPMRELRGFGRAENAFFEALARSDSGAKPQWAELAESSGYSDQSHFCRETRRITGFSPDELFRRISEDENFWSYRLWE